jgi:YgiT-type zinc finger domain-containing protein
VSRSYGTGKKLLVVERVPVVTCPHCRESYLTAETLREIERVKRRRKSFSVQRPVQVAQLA